MINTTIEISDRARQKAMKYLGKKALEYEQRRVGEAKWKGEDQKVKEFLNEFPKGTSILDIPCGTGRFFPFYRKKGFRVLGIDISPDMLILAKKRARDDIEVATGNIFNIEVVENFDAVLCIRFLNLIMPWDLERALAEMQRVARNRIIFTLRVDQGDTTKHYHHAYKISVVENALLREWKIGRNEPMYEKDYRLIELVR